MSDELDQVFISDLLVRGVIGITEEERSEPQDILINVVMYADTHQAAESDHIHDCVNYATVAKKIFSIVDNSNRKTVEALATDIADFCLSIPCVQKARVRVEKPTAVRFARSAGVEIVRSV